MPLAIADGAEVSIPLDAGSLGSGTRLPIQWIGQQSYKNLCWAACCAMVTSALRQSYPNQASNLPTTLIGVATEIIQGGQCAIAAQSGLDQPLWPDCALFELIGLAPVRKDGDLAQASLVQEIQANRRPVLLYLEWTGIPSAHMVLLAGYDPSTEKFLVLDPAVGTGTKYYNELSTIDGGTWNMTFYNVGWSLN